MYKVIKTGKKRVPNQGMSDIEVLQGFWELEVQLGLRESVTESNLLDIPALHPVPLEREELKINDAQASNNDEA